MTEQIELIPNWKDGLLPAIVQDANDRRILMLGYMNEEARLKTLATGRVTFYSRKRQKLWTKGETSGHFLTLKSIALDCDQDTFLIQAVPNGPVCHTGQHTCFNDEAENDLSFLAELESVIDQRFRTATDQEPSYTQSLFLSGMPRMAQKVGEEGLELALAAVSGDEKSVIDEAADLVFHTMVLLRAKKLKLGAVVARLKDRHKKA